MNDIEGLITFLVSDQTKGYGKRPIPDSIDSDVRELIGGLLGYKPDKREAALSLMKRRGSLFCAFAERMASLAVRTADASIITDGMHALGCAASIMYWKEIIPVISLLYDAAQRIHADPIDILAKCHEEADPSLKVLIDKFLEGGPSDRSISAMGYEESKDADGFRYARNW